MPVLPVLLAGAAAAAQRNVLYILVDDLRTQLGAYHKDMHTPGIDAFAATPSSLLFEQAHCQSQMCVPTRNSFMTGRRPATTLVMNDGIGNKNFRVTGANWTTLPQHFKNNGYFTTGVGKSFHPNSPPNFDQPMSWSDTDQYPYYYPPSEACPADPARPKGKDVWCAVPDNSTFEDTLILEEGKRRLNAAAKMGKPFFLAVGFHKPHTPYRAPQRFFDMYPPADEIATAKYPAFPDDQATGLAWFSCKAEGAEYPINHSQPYPVKVQQQLRRAYYASVSYTDDNIRQLLDELTRLRLENDTVVALHSDHGYQLGERNQYCKETNYDLATHVPLIVRAPQYAFPAARSSAFVELVDVFPTLAELAGVPALDVSTKGEPPPRGHQPRAALRGPDRRECGSPSGGVQRVVLTVRSLPLPQRPVRGPQQGGRPVLQGAGEALDGVQRAHRVPPVHALGQHQHRAPLRTRVGRAAARGAVRPRGAGVGQRLRLRVGDGERGRGRGAAPRAEPTPRPARPAVRRAALAALRVVAAGRPLTSAAASSPPFCTAPGSARAPSRGLPLFASVHKRACPCVRTLHGRAGPQSAALLRRLPSNMGRTC